MKQSAKATLLRTKRKLKISCFREDVVDVLVSHGLTHISRFMRKPTMWLPTRTELHKAQKVARGWKFWMLKVKELYYPCSENKGIDQLRSYWEADLPPWYRIYRLFVFS